MAVVTINQLLQQVVQKEASDLHLRVGMPPEYRRHGELQPMPGTPVVTRELMTQLIAGLITKEQQKTLMAEKELDLAYALPGLARFRVNVFFERGQLASVMRRIPEDIPTPEQIGLPPVVRGLSFLQRGLVLVTGPTGSGKSTTLAAMMRIANEERNDNIITVEDPIEFVHQPIKCMIRQRELGQDTFSFGRALRAALRQDPDIILVGEMRDLETMEIALTAAETGHLVFSTLHTRSANSTIDRIIDAFPAGQQQQVRTQLATSLQAVITQTLLPTADGAGRVAAHEILLVTDAVRNLIRENKPGMIRNTMQTNTAMGMQTMDRALANLALSGRIDHQVARERAMDPGEFERLLRGGTESMTAGGAQQAQERQMRMRR